MSQFTEVVAAELDQLWDWNSPVPTKFDRCIHEYFLKSAKNHPSKQAVVSWDGELSYGQVERMSCGLAAHLIGHGVTIGDPVPLCFEKSIWTIVAVMAVLRAGGTLVMTDPSQPEERLRTIVTEVGAKHVLSSCQQAEKASRIGAGAQLTTVGPHLLQNINEDLLARVVLPEVPSSTTLYIQFTSGSTGKPKGVVISHTNYVSGAVPRAQAIGYTPRSRVLDFASYAFDVSFDCMFCTLAAGGTVCEPSELERLNDMNGAIKRMSVNMAHMTPSVARILTPDAFSTLEVLGLGGEAVSASDMALWGQHTKIAIAYGPSECTVGCTVSNDEDGNRKSASIGKGVGGSIWLVDPDDHHRLVPIGTAGELLVEGPIVGDGYLNNPLLTSQAFIEDPKWLLSGSRSFPGRRGRLYKTGDLVKHNLDGSGSLIFVGRRDQQVKIRGQRVELEEIEYHLKSKLPPNVSVAAEMIVPKGANNDPTLVAFLAEKKENYNEVKQDANSFSPTVTEILQNMNGQLSTVLPRYMVPNTYIPLEKIPLMVSCKTDRKTLRHIGSQLTREDLARFRVSSPAKNRPMTDIEATLRDAWQDVLSGDLKVGVQDDFFSVGGDSLKAMKLVSTLRAAGVSLTVGDIFSQPVLEDMAATAKRTDADAYSTSVPPFSLLSADWAPEDARAQAAEMCGVEVPLIEDVYPCSPLQEGFMALSAKVSGAYVAQRVVELPDAETASKLQMAFNHVVADQPVLRTKIVQIPGRGLMQAVVREPVSWNLADDLQGYLERDRENTMELNKPLSRLGLISTTGQNKVYLVWTIHHALYDGWSMPLIVRRINEAYQGLATKSPTPYNAFIKSVCGVDRERSETYWRGKLQGAVNRQFPVVPVSGYQARAQSLLEYYVPLSLKSVSSTTTIANAIRGAWALTAALYASSNDVVFGETLTGRNAPVAGIEEVEGPTITTVPVRMRINKRMTVSDFLRNILAQTAERIPHEHFGLQHIRRVSPDAREACDLRTGIVIHPPMEETDESESDRVNNPANGFIPADDIEAAREALNFNSFALMLVFSLDANGFLIMASFDSELVDVAHMQGVLERFGETVKQLSQSPRKRLEELDIFADRGTNNVASYSSTSRESLAGCEYEELANISDTVTSTWIVDPSNPERLLPPGAVGELLVQGKSDALKPLASIPHWFSNAVPTSTEVRLYHTGRVARQRADGTLMFVKLHEERPDINPVQLEVQDVTEGTDKERKMATLWSRILGVPEDSIHSHSGFFDLGGDSIMAMRLVSEARLENLKLTVAQIFIHRLFSRIVAHTEEEREEEKAQQQQQQNESDDYVRFSLLDMPNPEEFVSTTVKPSLSDSNWGIADVYPVRPLQKVAIDGTVQLPRFSARYEALYFKDPVDWDRLRKSCQELINRNEILRTVFVEKEKNSGEYLGVILKALNAPIDTYETDRTNLAHFVNKFCRVDAELCLPLGSAFVKFFFIHSAAGQQSSLVLRISHAQYDELCLPVLLQQLSALYEDKPESEIPRSIPFSTHVRHVLRDNIPRSGAYWRDLLKDSKMSIIRPETPVTSRKHYAISREFTMTGRPSDVTIATFPTAAWALCLATRLSTRDVVFGEVVSGRHINLPRTPNTAPTDLVMGPCWQYAPVRINIGPSWTGHDLLRSVQNQHITSAPHEGVGLSEIIQNHAPRDWLAGAAGTEREAWFDSVVHQDVRHVEDLPFLGIKAELETIYPHEEPLREWKIQAFPGKKGNEEVLTLEVVTVESWEGTARELLNELGDAVDLLVKRPGSLLLG